MRRVSKILITKKGLAEWLKVSPEFKPQYHKKKKKVLINRLLKYTCVIKIQTLPISRLKNCVPPSADLLAVCRQCCHCFLGSSCSNVLRRLNHMYLLST
jgi:hypothetical protein